MEPNQTEEKPTIITPEQEEEVLPVSENRQSIPIVTPDEEPSEIRGEVVSNEPVGVQNDGANKSTEVQSEIPVEPTVVREEIKESTAKPIEPKVDTKHDGTTKKHKSNGILIGLMICLMLSICGIGFGIWTIVDRRMSEASINSRFEKIEREMRKYDESNTSSEIMPLPGKPSSASDIQRVLLSYDGGEVEVFDDYIDIIIYNEDDSFDETKIRMDTSEIFEYVFENDLQYLSLQSVEDVSDWSIYVEGYDTICSLSGEGQYPAWYGELLAKINSVKQIK